MSKLVVLNIDEGNFEQGFPVRLEIGEDGSTYHKIIKGSLPPAPELPELYEDWKEIYHELGTTRQIDLPPVQVTNCSQLENCQEAARKLEKYLRGWFAQLSWRELRVRIEENVQPQELVRVIFHTENIYLQKLPWHLWDLFDRRQYAQFALSADYALPCAPLKGRVRILAIFGGSQGLDLTSDLKSLNDLERNQGATVKLLEKPRREELSNGLWEQRWDILFFAGHSSSQSGGNSGLIQINDTESISLNQLKNSLRTAVRNGLKLAIVNSCDGLGLASELSGLGVPQMIIMREPVPDEVARQFLHYFLNAFTKGEPFYLAVRKACERLEWMEQENPCASWLPIICQNPAAKELRWPKKLNRVAKVGLVASVAIALTFIGYNQFKNNKFQPDTKKTPQVQVTPTVPTIPFSWGDKILINFSNSPAAKKAGVQAFANKNFPQAIEHFRQSRQQFINDPETLIYLNNAVSQYPEKITQLPILQSSNLKTCVFNQNTQKPLNIAVSVPIGLDSRLAQEILRGVAQAQNEINCKGGINGRLLRVAIVDDKDEEATVKQVAGELVKNPEILGVIGHYSSSATRTAGKIYDGKLVAISATSNAIRRSKNNPNGLDFSKYVFRTTSSGAKELVEYMVNELRYKKAAIAFDSQRDYSKSFHDEFKQYLISRGGEVVDVGECHLDANFRAEDCVKKANENQAQVLLIVPENHNTYDKALPILDANYNSKSQLRLLGASSMYIEKTLAKRHLAENLVLSVSWHRNESNPSQFERDAQYLWGTSAVSWHTKTAYDATVAIVEGLKRMGDNPTRQGLKKELSASDFLAKGTAGDVQFDDTGDRVEGKNNAPIGVVVKVQPAPNSKYGYQFVLQRKGT